MIARAGLWLPSFCILAGVCLLAWVGYDGLAPLFVRAPALEVQSADIEIRGCAAGEKREIVLRLNNSSGEKIRVLGLVEC